MALPCKEFLIIGPVLIAMIKWKGKSCAPWSLLYPCCHLWVAAIRTLAAKGPPLQNKVSKASGNTLCSHFWRSLVQAPAAHTSHPGEGWCKRMGSYKPGGTGFCPCLSIQQLQTANLLPRMVNLMKNEFLERNQKLLEDSCYNSINSIDKKKGGKCWTISVFSNKHLSSPGNTNTFHFKILNKKTCWTSVLFQNCPKLKKKEQKDGL